MEPRYFVIGDVHGMYDLLMRLMRLIRKNGFSFKKGDILVQLGDRCDRGPDTFRVNNYFFKLQKRYPNQIICLKGNHEDMMIKAAIGVDEWGFLNNGGEATLKSYGVGVTYIRNTFPCQVLGYKLKDNGHLEWLSQQPHYVETDKYLFTHAPIPKKEFRQSEEAVNDFRDDPNCCFWSYVNGPVEAWVDHEPAEGKISVHGHIHGLYRRQADGQYMVPGIRQVGNSFLIDTGSGCAKEGYLTCLELPSMTSYDSNGVIAIGQTEKYKVE